MSLASLALLSTLGICFVGVARQEAVVSRRHLDGAHARMVALAGVEYAVARLRAEAGREVAGGPTAEWDYGGGPLSTTPTPSYYAGTACGHAYSVAVSGTYARDGDQAVLKILDTASQLDLNLQSPGLARMLDTLGLACRDDLAARGLPAVDPIAGRGAAIVALRDASGGLRTKDQIRALLGDRDYALARDFLTVHAWTNPTTVAPTGTRFPENMPGFRREARAPVNVNGAAKPVLVAVLAEVSGPAAGARVTYNAAAAVADAILARRAPAPAGDGPFRTWPEFHRFLQDLTVGPGAPLSPGAAAALAANADPNFHPARLNLDRVVNFPLDKSDLAFWTTDFCLQGMGLYEIVSLGRLFPASGAAMAGAQVETVVRAFNILYHTVQTDFDRLRASSRQENATTWPNASARAGGQAADWAGHIALQTDVPARDARLSEPTLEALLRDGLDADEAEGSPRALTEQEAGPDVARAGGDLLPEGLLFASARGELTAYATTGNVNPRSGGLEFWVKFDARTTRRPVPLMLVTVPTDGTTGVQHRITAALDRGVLTVESTRVWYVARSVGPARARRALTAPYTHKETTWTAVLPGMGTPHEWHHVEVDWSNGTSQRLTVDGVPGVETSASMGPNVTFEGWPPYLARLYVGGAISAAAGREVSPGTIDDLRVYGPPGLSPSIGEPRSRFEDANAGAVGRFESAFAALPQAIDILGVRWTEWTPRSWSGRPFARPPAWAELRVTSDGTWVDLPNGANAAAVAQSGLGRVPGNRELRYEFRFRRDPGALPLNVTPIVDDLLVAYSSGAVETLFMNWSYDD